MAVRGPRRAPFGAPRSARPLLPAEGVYSAGRDGERDLKEDLDEGTHKRDGGRYLKEDLDEGAHKRDGERDLKEDLDEGTHKRDGGRLWRCALSAGVAGVREQGYLGIYYKSTTCRKPLCAECRECRSQRTVTEDSSELGGAPSCQRKLTRG